MDKQLRILVIANILLAIAAVISTFTLESYLPPVLQEYLATGMMDNMTATVGVVYLVTIILLLGNIVALAGLLLTKLWAKNLFIYTTIGLLISCFFIGAYVDHAVAYAFDQVSVLVSGMIIALLVYNSSYTEAALNKASQGDA